MSARTATARQGQPGKGSVWCGFKMGPNPNKNLALRKPYWMADRKKSRHRLGELASRCPRGARSGADVGRQVFAGEGGAGRDEVGGCALEDDPPAVVASAGAEVDDPVGVRHDSLMVRDDDDRLAGVNEPVEQAEQPLDVSEVKAGGRLVEHVDIRVTVLLNHPRRQLEPLPLAA